MTTDWREVLCRMLDGDDIDELDAEALAEALDADGVRRESIQWLQLEAGLRSTLSSDRSPLDLSRERLLAKALLRERALQVRPRASRLRRAASLTAAAAMVLIAVGVGWRLMGGRYQAPRLEGAARIVRQGAAIEGAEVHRGDRIVAGPAGAKLTLGGYCELSLDGGTEILWKGQPREEVIEIEEGSVVSLVSPEKGEFQVITPTGSLDVRGTEFTTTVRYPDRKGDNMERARTSAIVTVAVAAGVVGFDFGSETGILSRGMRKVFGAEAQRARSAWQAKYREARRLYGAREFEKALPLYKELARGDVHEHAYVLNCLLRLGRMEEFIEYCLDNLPSIVQSPSTSGLALYQFRRLLVTPGFEEAAPHILAAVDRAVELQKDRDPASAAVFLHSKGLMLKTRGDLAAALEVFEEVLAIIENTPDAQEKIFYSSTLSTDAQSRIAAAECHLALGDPVAAYEMVEEALSCRTLGRTRYAPIQYRNLFNRVRFAADPDEFQVALRQGVLANAVYRQTAEAIHAYLVESLLDEGQLDEALVEAKALFWSYSPVGKRAADVIVDVLSAHDKTRDRAPSFPDFMQHYTLGPDGVAGTDDDVPDPWADVAAAEDSPRTKAIEQALSQIKDAWAWREHLHRGCLMRLADRPKEGLKEIALSFAKTRPEYRALGGVSARLASAMRQVGGDPRLDAKIDALLGNGAPATAPRPAEPAVAAAAATEAPWQEHHARGTASLKVSETESAVKELALALALIRRDHAQMPDVAQSLAKAMGRYRTRRDDLKRKLKEFRRVACPQAPR